MRLARIRRHHTVSYAAVEKDGLHLIEGSPFDAWAVGDEVVPLDEADLLAPVAPPQVLAIGLNYRRHAAEGGVDVPDHPLLFLKAASAVIGPGAPIVLPRMAPAEVDYEAELVLVIGKACKEVTPEEAPAYILGCTCGNDVSARDCQLRLDKQWARGKSFDSFAPLGPWIETDLDPTALSVRSTLNGTVMQDSSTADMVFGPYELVSYLSQCMTLLPGSVIFTGTPEGVGMSRTPPVFLREGDTITIAIEGIGELTNPVTAAG